MVRASAFGNPGVAATGSKYSSSPACRASCTARAAIASAPAAEPGARRVVPDTPAARAASSVKLNRVRPKVAAALIASARTQSSAAPREAPTTAHSVAGGNFARNARTAPRRADADVDVTICSTQASGRHAGFQDHDSATLSYSRFDSTAW